VVGGADYVSMLVTFPQAKVLVQLALATVLGVIAVALLGVSAARRSHVPAATPVVVATGADASPGSTAHARHEYRSSLQR